MPKLQRRGMVLIISAVMLVGTQAVGRVLSQTPARWPIAPTVLSSPTNNLRWVPTLQIAPTQPGPLAADPLETFTPGSLHGTLIYLPRIVYSHIMFAETFFTFRAAKPTGDTTANYLVNPPSHAQVFDPQFSPTGGALVFKVGSSEDPWPSSQLCLWNFQTNRVSVVNSTPITDYDRRVAWSPDGQRIAYFLGGYDNPRGMSPVRLFVYNLKTGKSSPIAHNPGARNFAWTLRGVLLYLVAPPHSDPLADVPSPLDLYESAADGGPQRKVLANAVEGDIAPSPDGRWIAFLGWGGRQGAFGVCLYDRRRHTRRLLQKFPTQDTSYPSLRWAPDSRRLYLVETHYRVERPRGFVPTKDGKELGQAIISVADVTKFHPTVHYLATIPAQDFSNRPLWYGVEAHFDPMHVTHDGKAMFLSVSVLCKGNYYELVEQRTLLGVDLRSGRATTVARLLNKWNSVVGWDWLDR